MILKAFARRLAATLLLALLVLSPAAATVNSTASKTIVLGNGITTSFSFSFVGVAAAYISVILTDASGNETVLTQGAGTTQYTITLNPPVTGAIWGLGGSVVYNPSGTPVPSGSTLTIFRTLPLTQAISLQNQNSLARLGNGAETGLDIGVMQTQQQVEVLNRAIVAPIVDATPPAPLPPIAQRANQGAAWDSEGNLIAGQMPAGGVISSAMQPVVNAATLAVGRTALGLGGIATEGIGAGLQDDGSGSVRVNSSITSVAVNQAIHSADHLKVYAASGALTFTLDRSNTLFSGFSFTIYALTGDIVLTPNANDNFFGLSSGASLTIPVGSVARISTDGGNNGVWYADPTGVVSIDGAGGRLTISGALQRSGQDLRVLAASKANQQAGSSATAVVTPSQQQSHDSAVKAWVLFSNTGTILSSYNVTTVTHPSTGIYNVIFTTAFASTSYACGVTAEGSSGGGVTGTIASGGRATSSLSVSYLAAAGTAADPGAGHVMCHGRQ